MKSIFAIIASLVLTVAFAGSLGAQNEKRIDRIYTTVDVEPKFPGGMDGLALFLQRNIKYPKAAQEANLEGTVYVSFVVERNGEVSNVKILRGIGYGCEDECIRVVKLMPKWKPGKNNGRKVRVQYNLPVRFILSD